MNRKRVYELASAALASKAGDTLEQAGVAPPDQPGDFRRTVGRMTSYERSSFLYDLAHQLAEAGSGRRPKPVTDEGWAEAVVQSYLARTAAVVWPSR